MPDVLFKIPLNDYSIKVWRTPNPQDVSLVTEMQRLRGDGAVATVDEAGKACLVYIEYKDFRTKYPNVAKFFTVSKRAEFVIQEYATDEYRKRAQKILDDARERISSARLHLSCQ